MGALIRWAWQPPAEDIVCIAGKRGSGKSFWTKEYLRPIVRAAAWDPLGEYHAGLGGPRLSVEQFEAIAARGKYRQGIVRVSVAPPDDWTYLVPHFQRFLAACQRVNNLCVIIEETSLVAGPSSVPPEYKKFLAISRHTGCSACVIGQRFAQFPRLATAGASRIVIFRQSETSDLDDAQERFGEDAPADSRERILHFKRGEHADFDPENGAVQFRGPIAA